jgi:nucleolar pre-ribosomal-associated protein 1
MFDHDPAELALWLEMLPRTRRMDVKPSPTTILERLQLLSFLDDCVRRCIKTPYRYLEDVTAFMNEEGRSKTEAREMPSPLLFTLFEQLQAKLAGHHIAASAGQVILDYASLLILAFSRKVSDLEVALALARKLESCITQAEVKRESTLDSLRQTCSELQSRIRYLSGETSDAEQKDLPSIYVEGVFSILTYSVPVELTFHRSQVRTRAKCYADSF